MAQEVIEALIATKKHEILILSRQVAIILQLHRSLHRHMRLGTSDTPPVWSVVGSGRLQQRRPVSDSFEWI